MKNVYKQKRQEGFTIIEVLIVLAIAALILLIVFLAVPSLQRNSRNTQRKSDVANLLASVADYAANNNGKLPATCSGTTNIQFGTTGTNATSESKAGYYTSGCIVDTAPTVSGQVELKSAYTATTAPVTNATADWVIIVPKAACASNNDSAPGNARQIVAIYQTESGPGKYNAICQES